MKQIISGGQTGADQAALDACLEAGFPCGGFCPSGRKCEGGIIDDRYPLEEIEGGYGLRTERNLLEASGTVIFFDRIRQGGTELTLQLAIRHQHPCRSIDISQVSESAAVEEVLEFVSVPDFETLNVAGPRHSECSSIYGYVHEVVSAVIARCGSR